MNYKFILVFTCIIFNTNGKAFAKLGGGGARLGGGISSSRIGSSIGKTNFGSSSSIGWKSPVNRSPNIGFNVGNNFPKTSLPASNPNYGFLKGIPSYNTGPKIGNTLAGSGSVTQLKPVTSNNPSFGFLNGIPSYNAAPKIVSSPLTRNTWITVPGPPKMSNSNINIIHSSGFNNRPVVQRQYTTATGHHTFVYQDSNGVHVTSSRYSRNITIAIVSVIIIITIIVYVLVYRSNLI